MFEDYDEPYNLDDDEDARPHYEESNWHWEDSNAAEDEDDE